MKRRSASSARQFRWANQTLTLDQVAEFCRTRRVKEGIGSFSSVSVAFGPAGPIHLGIPGLGVFHSEIQEPLRAIYLAHLTFYSRASLVG